MKQSAEVVIIGAGPYGLSLAAHLRAAGVEFRIFGTPMHTWRTEMPDGMYLKSEGFASSLSAPGEGYTLRQFCKERQIAYADVGLPVMLATFVAYGQEFQRRLVPELENHSVVSVKRSAEGFELKLSGGETVHAARVVVAAGITHFGYLPPALRGLPAEFVSHSSKHTCLDPLHGKDVTIVGAGASALNLAALLHQSGSRVRVIARASAIHFHDRPNEKPRTMMDELRAPMTGLGPGWRSWLCVKAPLLFHRMPAALRLKIVQKHLGPAGGWLTREAVMSGVELEVSATIAAVQVRDGRLSLRIEQPDGVRTIETDHLIAATGFRVEVGSLPFLSKDLQVAIKTVGNFPDLSSTFESSVSGLYFIGIAAAASFGPMLRFAYGAGFCARRITRNVIRQRSRKIFVAGAAGTESAAETSPVLETARNLHATIE